MDGPVKILRRDWPAVNHREKHPYGSMDLDPTLTAADPLLFRDLDRSASLYRPFHRMRGLIPSSSRVSYELLLASCAAST